MNVPVAVNPDQCARLVLSLAHFLWEGALIALLAAAASLALRRATARARYGVHLAALVLMAASLPATFVALRPSDEPFTAAAAPPIEAAGAVDSAGLPAIAGLPDAPSPDSAPVAAAAVPPPPAAGQAPVPAARFDWRLYAPHVAWAYLAGVALMLLRVALAVGGGQRLRRRSEPVDDPALLQSLARQAKALGLRFTPAAAYCRRVAVPTVVGVLRPAVLLPLSLISGLTPLQIDLLLLHELAHIRRYDPLVNILQRIVEALLFFHPAVWYVSRRIRIEREHCCDDLVAALGGAEAYAASLVAAAALAHGRQVVPAGLAVIDRPSQLRHRVARLLGAPHPRVRLVRGGWLIAALAAPLIAVVFAQAAPREDAFPEAESTPAAAETVNVSADVSSTQTATGTVIVTDREPGGTSEESEALLNVSADISPTQTVEGTVVPQGTASTASNDEPDPNAPAEEVVIQVDFVGAATLEKSVRSRAEELLSQVAENPQTYETMTDDLTYALAEGGVDEEIRSHLLATLALIAKHEELQGGRVKIHELSDVKLDLPGPPERWLRCRRLLTFASPDGRRLVAQMYALLLDGSGLLTVHGSPSDVAESPQPPDEPQAPEARQPGAMGQLNDPDWWLRKIAVYELGETGGEEALWPLIGALKDEDPRVQAAAAEALGKLADPRACRHLVAALKETEGGVREAAATALTKFPREQVMPLLRIAAEDTDSNVRQGAIAALGALGDAESLQVLMSMLPRIQDDDDTRTTMARTLVQMDRTTVAQALATASEASQDPALRLGVARLLLYIPLAVREMEPAIRNIANDPQRDIRSLALASARSLLTEQAEALEEPSLVAAQAVATLAQDAEDPQLRASAVASAREVLRTQVTKGQEPSPELVEALRSALRDDRAVVMNLAAQSLEKVKWQPPTPEDKAWYAVAKAIEVSTSPESYDPGAIWLAQWAQFGERLTEPLLHMLKSDTTPLEGFPDQNLQQYHPAAAYGLGELRAKEAVPALMEALKDEGTAERAVEALGKIGDPAAVEPLLALLDRPVPMPTFAARALGEIRDPRAVPALLELLARASDPGAQQDAARALGVIGGKQAVPALVEAMRGAKDLEVREAAGQALGAIGDPAALPALIEAANVVFGDPRKAHGNLRRIAIEALGNFGAPAAATLVDILMRDPEQGNRFLAVGALGDIATPEAVRALAGQVVMGSEVASGAAIELVEIDGPEVARALTEALAGSVPNEAVVETLVKLKDPAASDLMVGLLQKRQPEFPQPLQLALARELVRRGDVRVKPSLEEWASSDPALRVWAEATLADLATKATPAAGQ